MTDILAEGRAIAEKHYAEGGGFAGKKNAYECDECHAWIVTIDRDPGVTPFGIGCGNCGGGMAYSKFYRVAAWLTPSHEWYRPETLDGIDPVYHEHLRKGGIILRPIPGTSGRWSTREPAPSDAMLELRKRAMHDAMQKIDQRADLNKSALENLMDEWRRKRQMKGLK